MALSIGFFYIWHGEYILKHKVVIVQTPQWKFKANKDRNATFDGQYHQFLPDLGQTWQTDHFQEFHFS